MNTVRYDIKGLDERSNESCPGIEESVARIRNYLQQEHETNQLDYSRMLLAGFSQGGALSLFTALSNEVPLAGALCLSGYLPAVAKFNLKQPQTKVFHGHGQVDPVVNVGMAQKTKSKLLEMGMNDYDLRLYQIPHTISPPELDAAREFLLERLPDDPKFRIQLKDPKSMSVKELKAALRKAGILSQTVGFTEKQEFVKLLESHRKSL